MKQVRIGSGAGYAGDRIEPAVDLIRRGNLDYIIFECLAERTISIAQKKKERIRIWDIMIYLKTVLMLFRCLEGTSGKGNYQYGGSQSLRLRLKSAVKWRRKKGLII